MVLEIPREFLVVVVVVVVVEVVVLGPLVLPVPLVPLHPPRLAVFA